MISSPSSSRDLIAVGIGKPHEPVGIVCLRRTEKLGELDAKRRRYEVETRLYVAEIRTLRRSDDFGAVADAIVEMGKPAALLVDVTLCGRAALPPLRDRELRPIPIVTTDVVGAKAKNRLAFEVGRSELRSAVLVAGAEGRLKIGKGLGAENLLTQMGALTGTKPKKPGEFEEEPRFELATALAIATWWSEFRMPTRLEQPRIPPPPIDIRPPTFNEAMKMARR